MRFILVGDPHVSPNNIEDAQKLVDYAADLASDHKATLLFLGDLHHNHAVMHLKVHAFWTRFFWNLEERDEPIKTIALVGNHDMAGDGSNTWTNSLMAHKGWHEDPDRLIICDTPFVGGGILFIPYVKDNAEFVKICNLYKTRVVFCHATFDGAAYENGFFAKDGIDQNLIPQKLVISGHIHRSGRYGKVWYPGSPRWLTLSDANQDKAIWYIEFDENYNLINTIAYPTENVCRKIYHLEDRESSPISDCLDPNHTYHIDIYGSPAWIEQRTPTFKAQGAKIRTFKDQIKQIRVKESDGVDTAFQKWVSNYQPNYGSSPQELNELVKERLNGPKEK